jgi:hypothetical protein
MALSTGAWIAVAAGAVVTTGMVVYVATRPAAAPPPGAAPAPTPSAITNNPVVTVAPAANAAFAAQAAQAAAAAAAQAAHNALVTNTTYQLVISASQNIQLKVGDTVRFIPSMNGSPPLATQWTYTPDASNASSVLAQIGTTNGADMSYQAMGPGFVTLIVKNTDVATGQTVFATYDVGITVVSA